MYSRLIEGQKAANSEHVALSLTEMRARPFHTILGKTELQQWKSGNGKLSLMGCRTPWPCLLPSRPLDTNCQVEPEHSGSNVHLVSWQEEVGKNKEKLDGGREKHNTC